LTVVGGVTDDNLTTFVDYVLALNGAEKTKVYQRAIQAERYGQLSILSEDQFFDILEGKTAPPEKNEPRLSNCASRVPTPYMEALADELERIKQDVIENKRINSLAKHGIPTPEGGRMKIDFQDLYKTRKLAEYLENEYGASDARNRCDICGKPAKVYINGEAGMDLRLCVDCSNRQMAEMTGTAVPKVPKNIFLNDSDGVRHTFEIEMLMFPNGISLIADEVSDTMYRAEVFGELDKDFDELWQTLIAKLRKFLSVKYMKKNGYFCDNKAIGYIAYNHIRDAQDIIIDGNPYTWQDLEKNIDAHEGFQIKIEFGDYNDILE
jgi:hypothetical protein